MAKTNIYQHLLNHVANNVDIFKKMHHRFEQNQQTGNNTAGNPQRQVIALLRAMGFAESQDLQAEQAIVMMNDTQELTVTVDQTGHWIAETESGGDEYGYYSDAATHIQGQGVQDLDKIFSLLPIAEDSGE